MTTKIIDVYIMGCDLTILKPTRYNMICNIHNTMLLVYEQWAYVGLDSG